MYKVAKSLFVAAKGDVENITFPLQMRVCIRNMHIVSIVFLKMWNVQPVSPSIFKYIFLLYD